MRQFFQLRQGRQKNAVPPIFETHILYKTEKVQDKSIDNLFLLEDGTYAIVNYEPVYKRKRQNKIIKLHYSGYGKIL